MRHAVRSMVETLGASRELPSITRRDEALWIEVLRCKGLSTPTLANKQSYAKVFFVGARRGALRGGRQSGTRASEIWREREPPPGCAGVAGADA